MAQISSNAIMNSFPVELFGLIMPWEDNKAIANARMVCKQWRHLIDSLMVFVENFNTGLTLEDEIWDTSEINSRTFTSEVKMGLFRRQCVPLYGWNQWSCLSTKQSFPIGSTISYIVRIPKATGKETKFTVTGGAILRKSSDHGDKFKWQRYTESMIFEDLHSSNVVPSEEKWYSIAHRIESDGVVTYEEGQKLFKYKCTVPPEGIPIAIYLQQLTTLSVVMMDVGRIYAISKIDLR